MDFPDETPFATTAHHMAPDHLDLRVLEQEELWVDKQARVHRLDQMSAAYLLNVALYLNERATEQHQQVLLANTLEQAWATLTGVEQPPRQDPTTKHREWLAATPLCRRLMTLIADQLGGQ